MKYRTYLENLVRQKRSEVDKLVERSDASSDVEEVRSIGKQIMDLQQEIREAEELLAEEDARETEEKRTDGRTTGNAELVNGEVVASFNMRNGKPEGAGQPEDMEYRMAFMNMVLKGEPLPEEIRTGNSTKTTDAGTAIPTVLVNKIIEKFDNVGMILKLVTKTSYAAGVQIPTSTVKPVASWVEEGKGSDRQKKTTGKITFTYNKLRCEISMSMEVGTMALSAFEAKFVENVAKAMTYAIENAVINGTGNGQPKGIMEETPEAGQSFTKGKITYEVLVEAEGAIPEEYEAGAKWCMNKKTFAQVQGMVDANGQPVARINYGFEKAPERSIFGRDVVVSKYVEDGKMFMFDFSDYVLNTIYDMGISKKQDWDSEDMLTKAVMSVDGKCVDKGSFVLVNIGGTPAE